jgi:hypothetical protein
MFYKLSDVYRSDLHIEAMAVVNFQLYTTDSAQNGAFINEQYISLKYVFCIHCVLTMDMFWKDGYCAVLVNV